MLNIKSLSRILFLFLFASFRLNAQTPEVLLIGDSWAAQQWSDQIHAGVFTAHGFAQVPVYGAQTTFNGSTAADWNTASRLQLISDEFQNNPGINVVQITLGGNDFLDQWRADLSAVDVANLQQQIKSDLDSIVNHVLSQGVETEVILSFYDYPNFVDTLTGPSALFCVPLWSNMAQPTAGEINTAAQAFESVWAQQAASQPRVFQVGHAGLMQNSYGFPGMGILPGDLTPPGDSNLPSPIEAMRFQADCFHLRAEGYTVLVENLFQAYFAARFDRVSRHGFEG